MRIHDLLSPGAIALQAAVVDKTDAIERLVELLTDSGNLSDPLKFRQAVFEREDQGSTGLGQGVAIPHARSAAVRAPALAAMVVKNGVEFDSLDGQRVYLLFLIASPDQATDAHMDVLARLSSLLVDDEFRRRLMHSRSSEEFLHLIDEAETRELDEESADAAQPEAREAPGRYDVVAVTACPAGLSHTYMAAEALENKAREMGVSIKVEADGAAGNRNCLLPDDIAAARGVIVAADRAVEMDRFIGKPLVRVGVVDGIQHPDLLITKALDSKCPVYKSGENYEISSLWMRLYRHLMSGLTYIMPLAATAGILAALARFEWLSTTQFGLFLESIGYSLGTLLFPVLSAFIAFSIGGRTALVAGFTGGIMADMDNAGVIGAVINGFVGGGVAFALSQAAARFLKGHDAMFALLVYPLVGATATTIIAQLVTNLPSALLNDLITQLLNNASTLVLALIGAALGGMMSADMGGPFNKLSYACGVLLLADCLPESGPGSMVMAAVMAGGMVPPLAAGAAALLARRFFSDHEREIALTTVVKGLLFITEGVLPYLILSPSRMRLGCVAGSAVAGALAMACRCGVCAPHGGVFLVPLADNALYYLLSLLVGTAAGVLAFTGLRWELRRRERRAALRLNSKLGRG